MRRNDDWNKTEAGTEGSKKDKRSMPEMWGISQAELYQELVEGKQQFVKCGWICLSSTCDYVVKDFVEMRDDKEDNEPT